MNRLCVLTGKRKPQYFYPSGKSVFIGRSPENDIQINDKYVSRKHLELSWEGHRCFIKDLDSTNGTFVNGKPIRPDTAIEIKDGYTVVVGMSVVCLGKRSSEDVQALLDSIAVRKAVSDVETSHGGTVVMEY